LKSFSTLTLIAALAAAGALEAQNPLSNDVKQSYNGIKSTLTRAAEEMLCGMAKGEPKRGDPGSKKTKAELTAALKESFDYCDSVYNSLTDADAVQMVKMFGRDVTKLSVLNFNIAHDNEMYGTAVAYLRIKGLVPPSSQPRRR